MPSTTSPMTPHPVFARARARARAPACRRELLDPRSTWADAAAYDEQATALARHFAANFERFAGRVPPEVAAAGPRTDV